MKRFKSSLECSYCSKILKDPIELPSQVKDNMKKINELTPNLSFSQDSFGLLRLNEYTIEFDF